MYWFVSEFYFFSSRRRHTRCSRDWSSDVCSSDLVPGNCTSAPVSRSGPWAHTTHTAGSCTTRLARAVEAPRIRLQRLGVARPERCLSAHVGHGLARRRRGQVLLDLHERGERDGVPLLRRAVAQVVECVG